MRMTHGLMGVAMGVALVCARADEVARAAESPFKGLELDSAVWQARASVTGKPSRVYLWIPPKAEKLRGVVIGQFNMCERPLLENPNFRAHLEKIGWGTVWIDTGFMGPHFDHTNEANSAAMQEVFDRLADASGLPYVKDIPFIGIGHSARADFGYEIAAWRPDRAVGAISYDGNTLCISKSYERYQHPFVTDADLAKMKGVPLIHRDSEFASGRHNRRTPVFRNVFPDIPFTILADPGAGHFGTPDETCDFLGSWVVEADRARNPNGGLPLVPVDPATGWYTDFWRVTEPLKAEPAPVAEFKGVEGEHGIEANWVFSEDQAQRMVQHITSQDEKTWVLAGYEQDGAVLPDAGDHVGVHPTFRPGPDGLSFNLRGVFLDKVPEGRMAGWTGLPPGVALPKPADEDRIVIRPICGPVVHVNRETMAVRFDRADIAVSPGSYDLVMIVIYPGSETYHRVEMASVMKIPGRLRDGAPQVITFPEIADVKEGTTEVPLQATSSAGLPVEYCVNVGPATLKDGVLHLTEIPRCLAFPVEVEVTAWQYGTMTEPKVQSAEPVTRTIRIIKR